MLKLMLFDGSEPCLALYSSLISHFRHFQKRSKNQCKQISKVMFFDEKLTLGRPRLIYSPIFAVCWWFEKLVFFLIQNWTIKKKKKKTEDEPRSVFAVKYGSLVPARGPQGAAFSRAVYWFPRIYW